MRVADLRHYFQNYGISRIFLESKKRSISKKKRRNYKSGYLEFNTREQAEQVVLLFNGKPLGLKKGSRFRDDFLCLKLRLDLSWVDLLDEKEKK